MTDPNDPNRYDADPRHPEAATVDGEGLVLVNKLGITNLTDSQRAEQEGLVRAYAELTPQAAQLPRISTGLIYQAHRSIFGEMYEWAGRDRTVLTAKQGVAWAAPPFIAQEMKALDADVLTKHTPDRLHDDAEFVKAAAEIQGEFLAIHPFREGNARTVKLCTDLLALRTGRPLLAYDTSPEACRHYIAGASYALHRKEYHILEQQITTALEAGRQRETRLANLRDIAEQLPEADSAVDRGRETGIERD